MVPGTMGVDWFTIIVRMTDPDAVFGAVTDNMLEEMAGEGAEEAALTTMGVPPSPLAGMVEELEGDEVTGMVTVLAGDATKEADPFARDSWTARNCLKSEFVSNCPARIASRT